MPLFLICFLTLCFFISLLIFRSRILRHSISIYLIPAHRVCLAPAEVATVAFYGVDVPAVAAFYNTYVIPAAVAVPVKENDVPWRPAAAASSELLCKILDAVSDILLDAYSTGLSSEE